MKNYTIISCLLCISLALSGCASGGSGTVAAVAEITEGTTQPEESGVFSNRDLDAAYSEADSIAIVMNGDTISCASGNVEISGTTVTIQKEGTYLLSGTLDDGAVIVHADKADKIQLVLNDVSIHSETSAPIYIRQADKVFITLAMDTQNRLTSGGTFTPDGDTNVDAVIFSKEDLTLNGGGSLTITSPGGHGVVSKDSLRITGGTYVIDAAYHGFSGQDEVSIATGGFDILAGKDGIHAENTEDAAAGTVYLENGIYRITAEGDGISASGSCRICDGEYTITTGGGSGNAQQHTANQPFDKGQPNRGGTADTMPSAGRPQDLPERGAGEKGGIDGGKGMDPYASAGGQEPAFSPQGTDTVSAKGVKASELTIDGGAFTIDSADDGLHANGNLTLRGGTLEIASGDDGIHADETAAIIAGTVLISESYEGIEGRRVLIHGGEITLTAADDGLNAAGGRDSSGFGGRGDTFAQSGEMPGIVISGGNVDITASGDGVDANGTLEITGGTLTVSGPTYGDTSVLDYDITGTISGGTFIGTGASGMSQSFSDSKQGVISANVGTQRAGTEIILEDSAGNELLSQTPKLDFEIVILSAPEIQTGASYTLRVGNTVQTFTAK